MNFRFCLPVSAAEISSKTASGGVRGGANVSPPPSPSKMYKLQRIGFCCTCCLRSSGELLVSASKSGPGFDQVAKICIDDKFYNEMLSAPKTLLVSVSTWVKSSKSDVFFLKKM